MFPFTLKQLKILKTITLEKNFTKASKRLHLSQPSLSKQITSLEKKLHVTLIDRNKNKISLTQNGKILVQYSNLILALCEESYRFLLEYQNGKRKYFIIGTNQAIGTYLIPKILALFFKNDPNIELKIFINSPRVLTKKLKNQEIDLAILSNKKPFTLKKIFNIQHFIFEEFILIISKSHPFAKKEFLKKEDLYCLNFITLDMNSVLQKYILKHLKKNDIETNQLKTVLKLNSIEAIKTTVSLGFGVAFVPSFTVEKEMKLRTLDIINIEEIKIKQEIFLLSNKNKLKSKIFESFFKKCSKLKKINTN